MKNKIKLNKKDKEILFYLDMDARSPLSYIAKKTKLSKQVVKYRIERLIKNGVIEKFLLFINGTKLGYVAYKFYIQFQNIIEEKLDEIIRELEDHPLIVWVATCEGNYDLAIAPIARNNVHAFSILNELLVKYNEYIQDILPLNYIDVSHMKKVHMTEFNRDQIGAPFWGNEPEKYELDDYEIQILSILSEEARKPIIEIAKEIGCSVDIVNTRLKKLLKEGIIQGSTIIMNRFKTGFEYHKLLLKIRFYSDKEETFFLEFVKSEDNITDIIRMMGSWNYELDIEVKDIYEFHELMLRLRNKFPTNIKSYDSLMILKEHKLNFFPMKTLLKEIVK